MDITQLFDLILGQGGVLVCLSVAVFYLWRDNKAKSQRIDELIEARLNDLKESEMLAQAYLNLREKEKGG